jgi:hypothetical protein
MPEFEIDLQMTDEEFEQFKEAWKEAIVTRSIDQRTYKVMQRWYRSVTPDGVVWCESRNVAEVRERSRGRGCTFEVMEIRQWSTPWERIDAPE